MPVITENLPTLKSLDYFKLFGGEEPSSTSVLIQENAGFHLGISRDIEQTGRHAASEFKANYDRWCETGWETGSTPYKYNYFTVVVGGGNTVKAVYQALLAMYLFDIDWFTHVRFFFLEESSGESKWESSQKSLLKNFIEPLISSYLRGKGMAKLLRLLELPASTTREKVKTHIIKLMVNDINLAECNKALRSGDKATAVKLIKKEAARYQQDLQDKLGEDISFHQLISGIGKDGGIGAFNAYDASLKNMQPRVVVLEKDGGAMRAALNRGIISNAEKVFLIIAGSLKLRALGRFEMEDSGDFEQSVLETPIRMLRESRELSEKVYIFADDGALHFDEDSYSYRTQGESFTTKAETREGLEENGVHILLVHGFMGLYTFINFLVRLPSAWTVSALHRGSSAKKMPESQIFPHYAANLRHAILKNWKAGSPTPVGFHSIAGAISDHLLLSIAGRKGPIPAFESLNKKEQQLVEALRCAGLVHMASWAPSDVTHIEANTKNLKNHMANEEPLDFTGPQSIYGLNDQGRLRLLHFDEGSIRKSTRFLSVMLKIPGAESVVNLLNLGVRLLLNNVDLHKRPGTENIPYALRLAGGRMIKNVSFYGLFKEVVAALHDPQEYQQRHIRALEAIIEYDIPYLSIIHQDDFLVSARRHAEEHAYLLRRRLQKEGVDSEQALRVPVRFLLVERDDPDTRPSSDIINPHLMLMSTARDGEKLSRQVTGAITRFVNENIARAAKQRKTASLASVRKWVRDNNHS